MREHYDYRLPAATLAAMRRSLAARAPTPHESRAPSVRLTGVGGPPTSTSVRPPPSSQVASASAPGMRPDVAAVRNRLLRALPEDDYAFIARHLTPVALPARQKLYTAGAVVGDVYFLECGGVSVINRVGGGRTVEVATVGPEGMVGLSAVLDAAAAPSETVTQVRGHGFRVPAAIVVRAFAERPAFRTSLSRYAHVYLTQVAQTVTCNTVHTVEQRCARWLLMAHDRADGAPTFEVTHHFLSEMLAVRRASVSEAAEALQRAGVITTGRGRVTVLDRAGLEATACECYGIVCREFARLVIA